MRNQELVSAIRFFSDRNWVPATSSNFSYREGDRIVISRSGVDKSEFTSKDLMLVDLSGKVLGHQGQKSSAETLIHCGLYGHFKNISSVLHTHSVAGTVLSRLHAKDGHISFQGYEVQKAFAGINTHESEVILPILSNDQDMARFTEKMNKMLGEKSDIHGFLIEGHGLYTWGDSISAAKRSIEAFEFLFECEILTRKLS